MCTGAGTVTRRQALLELLTQIGRGNPVLRYPLLWNRPSESEEELRALIRAVEEVHDIPQSRLLDLLRCNSIAADDRKRAYLGADDYEQQLS